MRVRALCYVTLLAQESLVEVNNSGENFHAPSGCIAVTLPTDWFFILCKLSSFTLPLSYSFFSLLATVGPFLFLLHTFFCTSPSLLVFSCTLPLLFLPLAMFHCSLQGGGSTGTDTNHYYPVNAGVSVNVLQKSLHYRLIKLLIKLSLIPLIIGFLTTAQTGFQRIKINRVVPPLSVCDKQLNDTFSNNLISYKQTQRFRDEVLQVFGQPNKDIKMPYVHMKNKRTQLFCDKVLPAFNITHEDVTLTYVHKKNKLMEDTGGSI